MRSTTILQQDVFLCKFCQRRLGIRMKETKENPVDSCFVCEGIMDSVSTLAGHIVENLKDYDYDTFLIGTSVSHTILDNEDELRSRYKIKGKDGIKSQMTKMLSLRVSQHTGKPINYAKPDVTVLAVINDQQVTVTPRSVWLSGRYAKLKRGLPQRSSICGVCNGLGCAQCDFKGRSQDSVQSRISEYLCRVYDAESCNFVWLGSEDENSLVAGSGRPFFVEITKPKKRFALNDKLSDPKKRKGTIFYRSKEIQLKQLEQLDRKVTEVPRFEITANMNLRKLKGVPPLDPSSIQAIEKAFENTRVSVRLSRKFRTVQKEVLNVQCRLFDNGERIELTIRCDGGIPLKKLISGQDESVRPNLSEYFPSYEIDRDEPFDVVDVTIKKIPPLGQAPLLLALNETEFEE
jgi:tRNA pseudouridine synthase 10